MVSQKIWIEPQIDLNGGRPRGLRGGNLVFFKA